MALIVALACALGLFLVISQSVDQTFRQDNLTLHSQQQFSQVRLTASALETTLQALHEQTIQLADRAERTPEAADVQSSFYNDAFATLKAIFPDLEAIIVTALGQKPKTITIRPGNRLIHRALASWTDSGSLSDAKGRATPLWSSGGTTFVGFVARANSPEPTTVVLVVNLVTALERFASPLESNQLGELLMFGPDGQVLLSNKTGMGARHLLDSPQAHGKELKGLFKIMLANPSGKYLCGFSRGRPQTQTCSLVSWDDVAVGGLNVTVVLWADDSVLSEHYGAVSRQRGLIAGLFGLALIAIAALFVRVQTQGKMAYKNVLLGALQDTSPDGVLVMDKTMQPSLWNQRLLELWGMEVKNEDEVTPAEVLELITTGAQSQDFAQLLQTPALPDAPNICLRLHLRQGQDLEAFSKDLHNKKGQSWGRVWYFRDITERIAFQQALSQGQQQLQSILDNVPTMVFLRDMEGRYQLVNRRYEDFFGWEHGAAQGKTVDQMMPARQASRIKENDRHVIESGLPVESEERHTRFGVEHTMLSRQVPVLDASGEPIAICGITTDITRRKAMEQRLRNALDEFEAIFENSLVGVMVQREGRTVTNVNERAAHIFGYTPEEVVGKGTEFIHLDREHFEEFGRKYYASLASGEVYHIEYPFRHKDGHEFWCMVSGKAMDINDLSKGVIWVVEDITEQRELEQLREDVDRIVRHDLKSPLSSIIHATQLLLDEPELGEESLFLVKEVNRSAFRMLDMINRSLSLLLMEKGAYQLTSEAVDLPSILHSVAEDFRLEADARGITLEIAAPAEVTSPNAFGVQGEPLLCYSLFANLVKNAVEASPNGERVGISLSLNNGVDVAIHNQGAVPEAVRENFFEKYATAGKRHGTGLGTYSAKLIAEAHGGRVSMSTSGANGTTVTVHLPQASS